MRAVATGIESVLHYQNPQASKTKPGFTFIKQITEKIKFLNKK